MGQLKEAGERFTLRHVNLRHVSYATLCCSKIFEFVSWSNLPLTQKEGHKFEACMIVAVSIKRVHQFECRFCILN